MRNLITFLNILLLATAFGQQTPASKQIKSVLFVNATVHTGEGTVLYNSAVGFENGKITYVGDSLNLPAFDTVVDATDKHIYPGFIATNSTLGLVEVDAVRATSDVDELGDFLPHVRTAIAYDAESKIVESMRPNGVLSAQVTPRGGRISGSSSVMQMDAWNWEDAI
ncbi:MAG: amidohydrolase, partial [Flavobacteriaceae bacterium]|nr:amidohydrolase [Flavobacteriaceae bacterium]